MSDIGHVREWAFLYHMRANMETVSIKVEGMKAANKERESHGYALAYNEEAFEEQAEHMESLSMVMGHLSERHVEKKA